MILFFRRIPLSFAWGYAELFFIGADKGGIIPKTALLCGFHNRSSLRDQGACHEKTFTDDVIMHGIAGFLFEFPHHMIFAEIVFPGKSINGQILIKIPVDIADQIVHLGIEGIGFSVERPPPLQKNPVQVHHKLGKQSMV